MPFANPLSKHTCPDRHAGVAGLLLLLLHLLPINTIAQSERKEPDIRVGFQHYFDSCGVTGTVLIADQSKDIYFSNDAVSVDLGSLPASTFKIINLLIALETRVIRNEEEIVKWPGETDTTLYGYRPDIYHDMSVREAFKVSAGWVFTELSKRIGKTEYLQYLDKCHYGNGNLSHPSEDFWNFGSFAVTPREQLNFLQKLYKNELPFSEENMSAVKRIMEDEIHADYRIHAKTGWTRDSGVNTGWWVGYVEKESGPYFFVIRLLQDRRQNRSDFGKCRKSIVKQILNDLNII